MELEKWIKKIYSKERGHSGDKAKIKKRKVK